MILFLILFGILAYGYALYWTVQRFFISERMLVTGILASVSIAIIAGGSALIYAFQRMNSPRYTTGGVIALPLIIAVLVIELKMIVTGLDAAVRQNYRALMRSILAALIALAIIAKLMTYLTASGN